MNVEALNSTEIVGCKECLESKSLDVEITMAFQPIVRRSNKSVFAHEALVRGVNGEGAYDILSQITAENRYTFDQTCRIKAIELASKFNMESLLSINFLPNAVYNPKTCIRATLQAADEFNFPLNQIMFEVTENEQIVNPGHLKNIFTEYKKQGFVTAIDDFGAGHSGLGLFVEFQPDVIKIDRNLITNINEDIVKSSVLTGVLTTTKAMGIEVIAEGIETVEEYEKLTELGVDLFQGYLLARPATEKLPTPVFP